MSNNNDQIESGLNKLSIVDKDLNINHENCYNPPYKIWCKECVPRSIIEGWTSGNQNIDEFIKDTIYNAKYTYSEYALFLEWIPFDKLKDLKQVGEGGFAKVYSATLIDGKVKYIKQADGSWKKSRSNPMKIALKRLNGSQNMSSEYLNEIKTLWSIYFRDNTYLKYYGITKDPETKEFMMITQFAEQGNLRDVLSNNFKNILWKDKVTYLNGIAYNLRNLHELGYFHKDFHSGNILQHYDSNVKLNVSYISDFGLSGPSSDQESNDKIYGVLPYIAPEVLNGKPYTLFSDIYSLGVIMTELSSGNPPFHKRKHDINLTLDICNGLRPEFGKGTPEIYKELAYKCMSNDPNQRPTANELKEITQFWEYALYGNYQEEEKLGYKAKEIKAMFDAADKEIPNISTSFEKDPEAIYTSRAFALKNLTNSNNSSIMRNNNDLQDTQLFDLEITSTLQARVDEQDGL